MEKIFDRLTGLFPGPREKTEHYAAFFHPVEVAARTILLKEGDISRKAWLIEKGCIRAWFNNKGKEITFQFFFEQEAVSSIESFRKNIPSLYTIETIEPCRLHWIYKKDMNVILKELRDNPATNERFMDILLERQFSYMSQFKSYIRDTPKERYLNLLREKPHIIQRVPQHYIASYLGITAVSLSRIRNASRAIS